MQGRVDAARDVARVGDGRLAYDLKSVTPAAPVRVFQVHGRATAELLIRIGLCCLLASAGIDSGNRKFPLQERIHALPRVETIYGQYLRNVLAAQKYDRMSIFPYFFVSLPANDRRRDQHPNCRCRMREMRRDTSRTPTVFAASLFKAGR
jgi:hypothetical protein